MIDHNAILARRGIRLAAEAAGWKPSPLTLDGKQFDGWQYPVLNALGQPFAKPRWKNADSAANPKYFWPKGQPENCKYYFVADYFSAVQADYGKVWLAGGEPNVLALVSAGIKNAFCWMNGEGSPPATLAKDLAYMGVTMVLYPCDRDFAGMRSAGKVRELLAGSGIDLILFQLPGEIGSKYDINDYWMEVKFDTEKFREGLWALPELDPVEVYLYGQQSAADKSKAVANVADKVNEWRRQWTQTVIKALGAPHKKEGTTERWHCPLPNHDDSNPSFSVTTRQDKDFPWPVCTCGIQGEKDAWEQVAAALNVTLWDDFKRQRAAEIGYGAAPVRPSGAFQAPSGSPQLPLLPQAPLYVLSSNVYRDIQKMLRGEMLPTIAPTRFPLTVLHRFGGMARFMWPEKVTGIVGISGGGKTLLMMTMAMKLRMAGYDVIWWGPEWDPFEYGLQDLQRACGMTIDQVAEWQVYKALKAANAPESEFADLRIVSDDTVKRSLAILDQLATMRGQMITIPDIKAPIDDVLKTVEAIVTVRRQEGHRIPVFCWDYAQLASMDGAHDWTWVERVVAKIKATCISQKLHGIVSAQVRKGDSEATRKGDKLTQGSAQGLTDHQFNLFLTLTPHFEEDGETMKDLATLGVAKNSMGRRGSVVLPTDFAHLTVLDQEAKTLTDVVNEQTAPALDLAGF